MRLAQGSKAKTAEDRVREHLARWEKDFHADLDEAVVAALREHEDDVRADERAKVESAIETVETWLHGKGTGADALRKLRSTLGIGNST